MRLTNQTVTPLVLPQTALDGCLAAVQADAAAASAGQVSLFHAAAGLVERRTFALWWRASTVRSCVSTLEVRHGTDYVSALPNYETTPAAPSSIGVESWEAGAWTARTVQWAPDNRALLAFGFWRLTTKVQPDATPPAEITESLYRLAGWLTENRPRANEAGVAVPTLAGAWHKSGAAEIAAPWIAKGGM